MCVETVCVLFWCGPQGSDASCKTLKGQLSICSGTNNTHSALTHSALPINPEDTCRTLASEISVNEHTTTVYDIFEQ